MFKALTQQLHEQYGGSPLTPTLNPATVARNFGVVVDVNEPLHESATALRHAEDEQESGLLLDTKKTPAQQAEPRSLFAIATARLQSIKPRTKERAQDVAQLIADIQAPLLAVDEMFKILEVEHVKAIHVRIAELRTMGRKKRYEVNQVLQGNVYTAMMNWNEAEKIKVRADTQLKARIERRRQVRLDKFSSDELIIAAGEKVESAVRKLNDAKAAHLKAEQQKAEAENALTIGQSELRGIEIAISRYLAELKGDAYHDPEMGLSTQPIAVQQ